jgi:hypothetical protein
VSETIARKARIIIGKSERRKKKKENFPLLYEKFPGEVSGGLGEEISRLVT